MKFTTVEEILAHKFVGNHFSDNDAFTAIGAFIAQDDTNFDDAEAALNHMSVNGMGLPKLTKSQVRASIRDERASRRMKGNKFAAKSRA
jgi:hypothetical protein